MIRRVLEMVAASAATSKVEAFNNFCQWLFFGKHGMFADNEPDEQEKTMKSVHSRGPGATRRRMPVVELLVQVEHACGSCPMSPVRPASSRWCCGCGL